MPNIIPLHLTDSGTSAEVVEVLGNPEQVQRVRELGFCNGTSIDVVQGGSSCIVKLGGNTICMRTNELLNIFVKPKLAF
jgi:Fe2+ transport system protein FeoA